MNNVNTEKLVKDMRTVIVDAEDLIKATTSQTGERIERVRAKAEDSVRVARERLQVFGEDLGTRAKEAAREVDGQVHAHPWATAGMAAGVGLLVGLLIGRNK
ncbi:MAG TPA: DUF883 family protein [Burkholderiales bacterium]|nr:DUF883 family protein [Burkholderiales bacterium]